MKATYKKSLVFRSEEQSLIVLHSLPLSDSKKLKLYPVSIQNPHHNMLSGNFYVSPSGDAFITGDIRGLIVSFKYVNETASYKSSVLTVVPGSVVDLKLTKGYLLLITCRVLPEAHTSPTLDHDVLEVIQNGGLTYYLYNINTRKLIKLELNTLLPSSLGGLNVSCISPVWLHGHDFHFACTLSHTSNRNPDSSSSSALEPNSLNSVYFCAVFSVSINQTEDSMQISFDSVLSIEKASFIGQSNSLRVLSSQISIDPIYPRDVGGDDGGDGDVKWRHFQLCMLSGESGLHSLSSNLLVYWTKPLDSNYSLFALLQPNQSPVVLSNYNVAFPIKSIELLTYSQQLGQINTVNALWLKPCHNYATRKRAFGGIGLEIWIIRQLPQGYELNNSEVVVLSTRPLRAHLIVLAPNITYADFFANSSHQNTSLIQSMLSQRSAGTGIKTATSTINNSKISSSGRTPPSLSNASSSSSSLLSLPAAVSPSVSSSSYSSKALVQSQLIYPDGNNNVNRRNSLMSFSSSSSRKYSTEKFKMSVFIPWPSKLLSDGNKRQSDIVEGYDIGVDACTLLDDDSESPSSHIPTVVSAKLTDSGSNSVLLSKSQLQSDVLCTSAGDGCTSERNPQFLESNDDSSLPKTEISRDNSSSTNVMYPSESSEISKISTVTSCSSSNFEEITTTHVEDESADNTHNINGSESEIPASTNQILTSSPESNNKCEVQLYQSVNTTTPTITTTNNPFISNILPTDESQMVSHDNNNNSNDGNMSSMLNSSSAWSIDFCLSSMTTTETSSSSSPLSAADTSQTISHLSLDNLKNDYFDLLPFVDSTGRPGIALHNRVNRKHFKSILAPLQFGSVYSIHISPNGKLIWCLVPPRNTSTNNNQHNNPANTISQSCKSFHVDVCLESNGILGLLKAWNSNDIGRWESSVLLEITSIDLCNTYAVFSTSSGHLKIQVGLSSKRPYNQSYTWPCPGYYIVQVTTCSAGLVWCLAIRQSDGDNDGNDTVSFDCDRFVILSSSLPSSLIEYQSSKSISTTTTTVTDQLKRLTWSTTFKLPSLLIRSLAEQLTSTGSLPALNDDLAALINCELQIALIDQKMKSIVKNQEMLGRSRITHYVTAWILIAYYTPEESDAYNIYSVNGYVQCIIGSKSDDCDDDEGGDNNNEFESISDWNQFTVGEINATTNAANTPNMSRSYFGDFFTKRITSKQKDFVTYPVPLIRYTHSIVNNKESDKDAEHKTTLHLPIDDIISNHLVIRAQPFRIALQRPWNKNTIIMQPIKSTSHLFTYYWKHYHHYVLPEIENINNIFIVQTFVNSDDNNNNGSSNSNAFIKCLWIPSNDDSLNKGIKCYAETQVKSVIDLLMPYPNEINDQPEKLTVSAMCLLASELSTTDGITQLFIAFTNSLFMSRIGISDQNPIGTQWVVLSCPDIWKTEEVPGSSTTVMPNYFTSICCIKMKLWATDNNGRLFTAKLLMNNINSSSSNNNSGHSYWETLTWTLDPACDIDRNPEGQSIHFKYITGANWESYGLGICLWSIGYKLSSLPKSNDTNNHFQFFNTMKYELQKQITHTMNSVNTESVYARCFREDSTPDKWYYWLNVPSPTPKSIHINNNGVWLLSSTYPSQIYHRIGLIMNHQHGSSSDHHNGNNNDNDKDRSLPAPKEHQIGYAWQSMPCPSVFNYPSLNISTIYVPLTVNLSKLPTTTQASTSPSSLLSSTQRSRQSNYAPVILYCLTSNGLFLSLSFGSIIEFTGDCDNTDENNKKEGLSSRQLALNSNSYDAEHNELIIIDSFES
ncbi:unnamed protein product [Trichobilharzia szidati]|nr:unnamed protein product [Trichobilharzia szidati]